jgi:hypothetical protein
VYRILPGFGNARRVAHLTVLSALTPRLRRAPSLIDPFDKQRFVPHDRGEAVAQIGRRRDVVRIEPRRASPARRREPREYDGGVRTLVTRTPA